MNTRVFGEGGEDGEEGNKVWREIDLCLKTFLLSYRQY